MFKSLRKHMDRFLPPEVRRWLDVPLIGVIAIGFECGLRTALGSQTALFDMGIAFSLWSCGTVFAAYFDNPEAALNKANVVADPAGGQTWQGVPPTKEDVHSTTELSRLKQLLLAIALWLSCVILVEKARGGVAGVLAWSPGAVYSFLGTLGIALLSTGLSANAIRRVSRQ